MAVKKKVKVQKKVSQKTCHETEDCHPQHPSHLNQKTRLNRIRGQIEGIDKMIVDNRYCLDIIYQIRAATSALHALEKEIMHTHIQSCVKSAIESDNHEDAQEKIQEIMDFF